MEHVRIMDIPFINESKINILRSIHNAIQNKNKKFIVTANPEIVMETRKDKDYKSIIQSADYIIPDGIGILLAAKRKKTDRKSTRLNSSHVAISYAVFCLQNKTNI